MFVMILEEFLLVMVYMKGRMNMKELVQTDFKIMP